MSRLPEPGETWNDRYQITAELGRGGFGRVYRGWDPLLERDVALKILRPSEDFTPVDHRRFRREINIAASLDHHNIVTVYDGGEHDGLLFLVMHFVNGHDLRFELERGPLTPERAVSIVRQVGDALDYAHGKGLVHRDVKPGNMLCQSGADSVFLADFGISRWVDQTTDNPLTEGLAPATLAYAAPEQLRTAARVDGRADVYALGCVLFECLTGRKPFAGGIAVVASAHLHEAPPRISDVRPDLSPAWDDVISRAMAKNPAERSQRCSELTRAAEYALPTPAVDAVTAESTAETATTRAAEPGAAPERMRSQRTVRLDPAAVPTERATTAGGTAPTRRTAAHTPLAPPRGPRTTAPVDPPPASQTAARDVPPLAPDDHRGVGRRGTRARRAPRWRPLGLASLTLSIAALLAWLVWPAISSTPDEGDATRAAAEARGGEGGGEGGGGDGVSGSLDDAQRQLLTDVGVFDASDCRSSTATSFNGERAAVACASQDHAPTRVVFRSFATNAQRDSALQRLAASAPGGDCRVDDRAVHDYRGADGQGRVLCAVDSATAGLSWTVPDQPIMGSARLDRPDAADDLYAWWATLVGRSDS